MYYLSSCSIVKDEDDYIDEFVKIHKKLGVEFFLFFDRSKNPLSKKYNGRQDIKVIDYPEPNRHAQAWRDGVKYFCGKSKWVQFIDIDEVVVPMKTNDIKIMLQDYEQFGALGLNWHTFGGNGYETKPDVSTYEAYTKRGKPFIDINKHIQSIVQVEKAKQLAWNNPHNPILNDGELLVNENKQPLYGPYNIPQLHNVGFIAHYYTKSRDHWLKKMLKLRADTGMEYNNSDNYMQVYDDCQMCLNDINDFTVKNIWNK